jgi:hypothetical protein
MPATVGTRVIKSLEVRFWEKVDKQGGIPEKPSALYTPDMGECWVWTGHLNPKTHYGMIFVRRDPGGKKRFGAAHRIVFLLTKGALPPKELEPDHLCKVRRCIRPSHLELVTHQVNAQRRTPLFCKRGHPFAGNMVRNGKSGWTCKQCKYMSEARFKGKVAARSTGAVAPAPVQEEVTIS